MILALTFKMTINFSSKTSLIPGHSKHTLRLWLWCSTFPSTPTSVITTIHHVTFHQNSSNKRGIIEPPLLIKALGQIWFCRCSVLRLQVCASRCHPPWSEWDSYWTPPCRCSGDIRWRYDMAWKTWQLKLRCRALDFSAFSYNKNCHWWNLQPFAPSWSKPEDYSQQRIQIILRIWSH